jgi:hypothetical protein
MMRAPIVISVVLALGTLGAAQTTDAVRVKPPQDARLVAPPRRDLPGRQLTAGLGTLFVPAHFDPALTSGTDVVVFFHGATWCAQQNFYDSGLNAVLISVNLQDYAAVFAAPDALRGLLRQACAALSDEAITTGPLGRLCLASFSGGYTAIREILRHRVYDDVVSDVVLADSLYAPLLADGSLETTAIEPFTCFARRAAATGQVRLIFSHLYPPTEQHRGNKTTLAAAHLIRETGAVRREASETNKCGQRLLYRADKGGLHILGYAGMTTQDHFEHFYCLSELLRMTTLSRVTPAKP